jgi:hypothetical protein
MEETISRSSGAHHGSSLEAGEIVGAIRRAGRIPRERATDYSAPVTVTDRVAAVLAREGVHDPSLQRRQAHPNLARLKPLDPAVAQQA